jgi:hypothetical protein
MKNPFTEWLDQHASTPGLLACGVQQSGQSICRSTDESCPAKTVETLLSRFHLIKSSLLSDCAAPCSNTWVFDQGQIRFVLRADGWLCVLVVSADSEAAPKLAELSNEFLNVK